MPFGKMRSVVSKAGPAALLSCALGLALSACTPTTFRNGYQIVETDPKAIKVGEDTKNSVSTKLGSPSAVATFEPNVWYYVSQTAEVMTYHAPRVTSRRVTVIAFDKASDKVKEVRSLDLSQGYAIAYAKQETPTRGRELTITEQLLGSVGRTVLPSDSDVPGQRRRE